MSPIFARKILKSDPNIGGRIKGVVSKATDKSKEKVSPNDNGLKKPESNDSKKEAVSKKMPRPIPKPRKKPDEKPKLKPPKQPKKKSGGVQVNPQDGLAWLDLATTYYSLSVTQIGSSLTTTIFNTSFNPQGLAAYQKAVDLLPEHPAPHAGLGILILAPYLKDRNAPPAVIHYVDEEYQIAKTLDANNPSLLKEAGGSHWLLTWLERAMASYSSNDASAMAGMYATETAEAALYNDATATAFAVSWACWAATGAECTATISPTATFIISTTAPLAIPSTTAEATDNGPSTVLIVSASVLGLIVVGYLALKRLPVKPSK